uniref:Uncharacterized protein n=1 Tax=Oryza sativa subsp. japonica TaxID=39947 RepID=Q6YS13_ORYSJ|nr:hypothetical protein [Oryza sativa Japonica Group]
MAAIKDLVGERGERIAGEGEAEEKRRTQGVGQLGAPPGRGSEGVGGGPAPGTRAMEEARAFGGGPALARARWGEEPSTRDGERKKHARVMGRPGGGGDNKSVAEGCA